MASTVEQDYASVEWSGDSIDVRRVEEGLVGLRREAAGSGSGTRTGVLNLIVYTEEQDVAQAVSQTLAALPSRHPSRSVIIMASPASGEGVRTRLSAHCHLASELERRVCCEEVFLTVRPRGAAWLRSVTLPLLISDLPVFLWWNAALPPRGLRLASMAEMADRLLLDSFAFGLPARDLRRPASLVRKLEDVCAVSDLNWTRLRPWRQVIAQMFQGAGWRPYLDRLETVQIQYAANPERGGSMQAGLLLGWLASRLGWRLESRLEDGRLAFRRGAESVHCRLDAADCSGLEAGSIVSCRLLASEQGADFRMDRLDDRQLVCVRLSAPGIRMENSVRIARRELTQLLGEELQNLGSDRVYGEALVTAAELLGAGKGSGEEPAIAARWPSSSPDRGTPSR